ncbi:MAG: hypothetical protein SAK29_26825 [Scytonema sp. PMC 1069.18]|nr:hypothetical protein [Scytonema sp. PMC 1069.18]MEC4880313.1 hypothetical protein [Scytonema sp. PMC 1070.18]
MNGNNRTNLFQKLATLVGVASAGTLLSLPAVALPNSNNIKISEAPVNGTIYSQTQTEEPYNNTTPGTQQYPGTTTTPGTQQYPGTTTTPGTQQYPGTTTTPGTQQYPGTTTTPGTQQYPGTTTTPGTQQYPGTTNDVTQPNYNPARPQQTTDDGTTGVQDTDGGVRALW